MAKKSLFDNSTQAVADKIIGMIIQVGDQKFRILSVKVFLEKEAHSVWKGKRAEKIRNLAAGEIIAFNSRGSVLTFIKTQSADNLLLQSLENVEIGERILTPKAVSALLGMSHEQEARLTLMQDNTFRFEKLSS